jgi:hypothetical protein
MQPESNERRLQRQAGAVQQLRIEKLLLPGNARLEIARGADAFRFANDLLEMRQSRAIEHQEAAVSVHSKRTDLRQRIPGTLSSQQLSVQEPASEPGVGVPNESAPAPKSQIR